jgi:hypothetical protein
LAKEIMEVFGAVKNISKLRGREVKLIGVVVDKEDGMETYTNLIVTLKDGKVVEVEPTEVAFNQADAINDAVAWVDQHYWGS